MDVLQQFDELKKTVSKITAENAYLKHLITRVAGELRDMGSVISDDLLIQIAKHDENACVEPTKENKDLHQRFPLSTRKRWAKNVPV